MNLLRDRPVDETMRLRSRRAAFTAAAVAVLAIGLLVAGVIMLVRSLAQPSAAQQNFTAPPFVMEFA